MIDTLIVEDNGNTLEQLKEFANKNQDLNLVGTATGVADAMLKLKTLSPRLLLLDIELGDGTAFDLLDRFQTNEFDIIFITGHDEYLMKAFEYFAFNFLSKPFDSEKFEAIVKAYMQKSILIFNRGKFNFFKEFIQNKSSKFLLQTGDKHVVIDLENVAFCKSDGNYSIFHLISGSSIMANKSLKFYSKLLRQKDFFRISRFHLINIQNICSIHKRETLILNGNYSINVTARNRQKLNHLIEIYNL